MHETFFFQFRGAFYLFYKKYKAIVLEKAVLRTIWTMNRLDYKSPFIEFQILDKT